MCSEPSLLPPNDETALLSRWRTGDPTAGLLLLRREVAPTWRYFSRRVPCRADVEDLVQRTLLAAIEALPRFREEVRFSGFVQAIATKQWLRHRRDSARAHGRLEHAAEPDAWGSADSSAVERMLHDDTSNLLHTALGRLPEASARILRLRYWEDRDTIEIGRTLELEPGAVRTRLHRARREMRRALGTMTSADSGVWPMGGM